MAKPDPEYLFERRRTPMQRIIEAVLPFLWLVSLVALGVVAIWA